MAKASLRPLCCLHHRGPPAVPSFRSAAMVLLLLAFAPWGRVPCPTMLQPRWPNDVPVCHHHPAQLACCLPRPVLLRAAMGVGCCAAARSFWEVAIVAPHIKGIGEQADPVVTFFLIGFLIMES